MIKKQKTYFYYPIKNVNNSTKKNKTYKNLDIYYLTKIISFYIYLNYLNELIYIKFKPLLIHYVYIMDIIKWLLEIFKSIIYIYISI